MDHIVQTLQDLIYSEPKKPSWWLPLMIRTEVLRWQRVRVVADEIEPVFVRKLKLFLVCMQSSSHPAAAAMRSCHVT